LKLGSLDDKYLIGTTFLGEYEQQKYQDAEESIK
jgi:hypothetical protein